MTGPPSPPAPGEPRCVILFASIHDVLRAEQALRQRGVWCDLVPVPRALSAECGMAVELRAADRAAARGVGCVSAWQETAEGYTRVD